MTTRRLICRKSHISMGKITAWVLRAVLEPDLGLNSIVPVLTGGQELNIPTSVSLSENLAQEPAPRVEVWTERITYIQFLAQARRNPLIFVISNTGRGREMIKGIGSRWNKALRTVPPGVSCPPSVPCAGPQNGPPQTGL